MALGLLLSTAGRASNASADPAYSPLILHMNGTTTLTVALIQQTGTGDCTLTNSGSSYVGMDLGSASTTTSTSCASYTSGSTYKLNTNVGIEVTCAGTCTTWSLAINLSSAAQSGVVYKAEGTTLSTTPTTLATGLAYSSVLVGGIEVDVTPGGSTPSNIQTSIVVTATAAGVTGVTATGTMNAELANRPGISIVFNQDASGVAMTGGAFAADLDLGTVSAFGTLPTGVTRPSVTASNYTVATIVDIDVENGGVTSSNYTLQSDLQAAAPTGLSYKVDTTTLTTSLQTITTTGAYGTNAAHTISIVISTSAPGSGGPVTGSALSDTLNFTATAN